MNLEGIASELKPNCEITRHVVELVYRDGGMKAVEAYISTFSPVEGKIKRYERLYLSIKGKLTELINKAYVALKSVI